MYLQIYHSFVSVKYKKLILKCLKEWTMLQDSSREEKQRWVWQLQKYTAHAAAAAAESLQSCPTLCDPIDGTQQAPPSLGFSRQERWSGLQFGQTNGSFKEKESPDIVLRTHKACLGDRKCAGNSGTEALTNTHSSLQDKEWKNADYVNCDAGI